MRILICLSNRGVDPPNTGEGPGIEEQTPTTVYQVQPGDTLETVAAKFGVTVEALIAFNKLEAPYTLTAGMILHIPPADDVIP